MKIHTTHVTSREADDSRSVAPRRQTCREAAPTRSARALCARAGEGSEGLRGTCACAAGPPQAGVGLQDTAEAKR